MDDLNFMELALAAAAEAEGHDDVPVGAVLVGADGTILAQVGNRRERDQDPTAHAEIIALREGAKVFGDWNLSGSTLYVSLEPCPMCAGAAVLARVSTLVYAATDPKGGAISLGIDILQNQKLNHRLQVRQGPLGEESKNILQEFFRKKRKK